MRLEPFIRRDLTTVIEVASRDELFSALSRMVLASFPDVAPHIIVNRLREREMHGPTSTPEGIAFPHAMAAELTQTLVAVVKVAGGGVDFGVKNHPPADLIFCMFGSNKSPWEHVRLLARLARLVRTEEARQRLREATDAEDLFGRLVNEDRAHP